MKSAAILIVVVAACGAGGWYAFDRPGLNADEPKQDTAVEVAPAQTGGEGDGAKSAAELLAEEDARMTGIVPGVWETNREGRRVLTVREDGTALMDVTVEGASSYIVGSKMKFNINWKIVDGNLDFEMMGGEPKTSVDIVISMYGKQRVQKILEFTEQKFVLKDNDGEDDHVWTRIEKAAAKSAETATDKTAADK